MVSIGQDAEELASLLPSVDGIVSISTRQYILAAYGIEKVLIILKTFSSCGE